MHAEGRGKPPRHRVASTRARSYLTRMPDAPSLADIARVAVDDLRKGREAVITPMLRRELVVAIELALLTAVRTERRTCAGECTRRAELWERTGDRPDT